MFKANRDFWRAENLDKHYKSKTAFLKRSCIFIIPRFVQKSAPRNIMEEIKIGLLLVERPFDSVTSTRSSFMCQSYTTYCTGLHQFFTTRRGSSYIADGIGLSNCTYRMTELNSSGLFNVCRKSILKFGQFSASYKKELRMVSHCNLVN